MKEFTKAPTVKIGDLDKDLNWVKEGHTVEFVIREGKLMCADYKAVDYYGEYRGGESWIAPELEAYAESLGGYWEWENPECITLQD